MFKNWHAMYENVHKSERLLTGNIMRHEPFIMELARLVRPGDKILEVGSGTGVLAWPLAQSGVLVTSLDNDKEILVMAEDNCKLLGANIELVFGDGFALPYPDDSFKLAYSHGLLEHFPDEDIHRLIKEQLRVAPVVLIGVPLKGCVGATFGNERWLTVEEWEDILGDYAVLNAFGYSDEQMLCVSIVRGDGSSTGPPV